MSGGDKLTLRATKQVDKIHMRIHIESRGHGVTDHNYKFQTKVSIFLGVEAVTKLPV